MLFIPFLLEVLAGSKCVTLAVHDHIAEVTSSRLHDRRNVIEPCINPNQSMINGSEHTLMGADWPKGSSVNLDSSKRR